MLLHTLGELSLEGSDFQRPKALLLLAYLALEGSQERQFLAQLFWDRMDNALGNLAMTLTRLREALPGLLETDNLCAKTRIHTDTERLDAAFHNQAWHEVLELYKGPFLQGVHDKDWGTELEEWVYQKREVFAAEAREALLHVAEEEARQQHFEVAAQHALNAYHLRYAPEPDLEQLEKLYLLLRAGNDVHATDVSKEAEGFGLQLYLSEEEARKRLTLQPSSHLHSLPFQATTFLGREAEKKQLAKALRDQTCRLLTIVGPGGIGKTRLAIATAQEHLEAFRNGVCFVSFASVASADLMVYTLADALGLKLLGQRPPKEQVLHYLKDKNMLLVLDNLEHLLSDLHLVDDILATAPEVKILATSRERLGLQSEHLFDLYGLSVPDVNRSDGHSSEALQLFAERAKHNTLEFALEQHLQAVTGICQLVGGMPLAIELAASWSHLLSPEEIARELEQNLDILATSTRDLPERHHRMRSVFDVSWQRLSDDEQTALRKLSVFQGGFTREAAHAVAEPDLPILLALVNKSFLWRDRTGRFSQHPLMLQYLRQKANDYPEEKKQMEEKHGLYYLELVNKLVHYLHTQQHRETRATLDREQANIRAAWDWLLREKRVEDIRRYARAFYTLFMTRPYEGANLFRQAVAVLDENNPEHRVALGYAIIYQLRHEADTTGSRDPFFVERIQRGLALLEPHQEYLGILMAHEALARFVWRRGDFARTKEYNSIALELARKYGNHVELGWCLTGFMILEREKGSFSEVSALMRDTLIELRELGNLSALGLALAIFGAYLVYNDQLEEGEKLLQESLNMLRTTDTETSAPCTDLARLAYKRGDFDEAERYAREAYDEAVKEQSEFMKATALAIRGRIKLAQGQSQEAEQLMLESLRLGHSENIPVALSHSLLVLAELSIVKGNVKQGVCWLSFLKQYHAIEKRDRDEAIKILEKAKEQLSARDFTEAQEASKSLTLEGIVTSIFERGLESTLDDFLNSLDSTTMTS